MPSGIQATGIISPLHLGILAQDLHHRSPLLLVLDQHAASATHVFNNIHHLAETGGCTACLREPREAEVGAAPVFEYDKEFNDKGYRLDLQVYACLVSACSSIARTKKQHYIAGQALPSEPQPQSGSFVNATD